jgi:hypothetical protein
MFEMKENGNTTNIQVADINSNSAYNRVKVGKLETKIIV